MRLEILIDSEEPIIYPLNKPEITIGAGDACDIILGESGVSRKHVKVIVEKDSYFVIDQGSSNGTFINEERLVPGRRTEFTSFFPVRLGVRVLLSLLSDEEAQDSILKDFNVQTTKVDVGHETTRIVSLKDLQASSTKKLISNRQTQITKKKKIAESNTPKKKGVKDSSIDSTFIIVLLILGGAYYYQFHYKLDNDNPEVAVAVTPAEVVKPPDNIAPEASSEFIIPQSSLLSKEKLNSLFTDLKCLIPEENYFCDLIPALKKGNSGVAAVGTSLIFLIEQIPWYRRAAFANGKYKKKNPGATVITDKEKYLIMHKLAFYDYLGLEIGKKDLTAYQEKTFYFVFYKENESTPAISRVFAIKVSTIPELVKSIEMNLFENFYRYGPSAIKDLDRFYNVY